MTFTSHIEIYQSDGDQTQIEVRLEQETLLVAESDPKQKETPIRLIMNMLSTD